MEVRAEDDAHEYKSLFHNKNPRDFIQCKALIKDKWHEFNAIINSTWLDRGYIYFGVREEKGKCYLEAGIALSPVDRQIIQDLIAEYFALSWPPVNSNLFTISFIEMKNNLWRFTVEITPSRELIRLSELKYEAYEKRGSSAVRIKTTQLEERLKLEKEGGDPADKAVTFMYVKELRELRHSVSQQFYENRNRVSIPVL